jgi:hypothetical protein
LCELAWVDITPAVAAQQSQSQGTQPAGTPSTSGMPLGIHLLMGPSASVRFAHSNRGLLEGRAVVIMGVFERAER